MDPLSHDSYGPPLERAHAHAVRWLESLDTRQVPASSGADAVAEALGRTLPEEPTPADEVVDLLAAACEPGLVAMPSGRFFGFVIGGSQPAALAADWLVSSWDQNSALRQLTPAVAAAEEVASAWLLDLLGLPASSGVGFVTGATMANFTGLAAGRDALLRRAGRDPADGLAGGPAIRVVAGAERHESVELALRYLGLPAPVLVPVDEQGRIRAGALEKVLAEQPGVPTIVVLQAGNLHSGAFDPFEACISLAHERDAWVHVDGAFGLWAAASPEHRHLTAGMGAADSWATDAHKTLNVPYDCGVVAVRDPSALRAAMGMQSAYLPHGEGDPMDHVPELSRRGRGIPVWAALRAAGRHGVAEMVGRMCRHARAFAEGVAQLPGAEVLNDVVFTQVCVSFGDDDRTRLVVERMLADGTAWMTGSRWRDRAVLRIAVSNANTTEEDVRRTLKALERAAA
ncbi:MAG TPA: aminotransferase class V-fold PLP-dependent enzyme [Marmoricola sp.]|nr:aminotransferase class V-fold PLP-dependent enzyme [Marmoricola sp.]